VSLQIILGFNLGSCHILAKTVISVHMMSSLTMMSHRTAQALTITPHNFDGLRSMSIVSGRIDLMRSSMEDMPSFVGNFMGDVKVSG